MTRTRVIAAMSGGVDSAVAAGLLVQAGYDVIGVTMRMYAPVRGPHVKSCCGVDDFDDARRSATIFGIPHYVLDFQETFRKNVIDRFADDYARGLTPNPCVACNNFVKMGTLGAYADRLGAAYVATGHYARIDHRANGPHLFRNVHAKDQAYALAQLSPTQLSKLLLPLGEFDKATTRSMARNWGLPVHDKVESQDICFVEGGDYRDVLSRVKPEVNRPGDVRTSSGELVGRHLGVANYTIGQRRRVPASSDGARYVTRIDSASNTIVIGREDELLAYGIEGDELNLIRPEHFGAPSTRALVAIRYRAAAVPATVTPLDSRRARITFDLPQRAVTPGQLAALYDERGEEVLGAATIREALLHL